MAPDFTPTPGRYVRTWAGFTVSVDVREFCGRLVAFYPSGWFEDVTDTPGATWERIAEGAAKPAEVAT